MKALNILAIVLLTILSASSPAQQSIATALFQTDLPDIEGREAIMVEVEYPPGVASSSHRHNAHTFVYVLKGTVEKVTIYSHFDNQAKRKGIGWSTTTTLDLRGRNEDAGDA